MILYMIDAQEDAPSQKSRSFSNGRCSLTSNTVMAVVPDSDRVPFSSTKLTTVQTAFSQSLLIYYIVTHMLKKVNICFGVKPHIRR